MALQNKMIRLTVSEKQQRRLRMLAAKQGISMAKYARRALLKVMKEEGARDEVGADLLVMLTKAIEDKMKEYKDAR